MSSFPLWRSAAVIAAALSLGAALSPVHAATASVRVLTLSGDTEQIFSSATPVVLSDAGTTAAVQFGATSTCFGVACGFDGPAVTAVLPAGSGLAEARLSYSVGVLGLPGVVPIVLTGQYAVFNPLELPDGAGGVSAGAFADVFRQSGATAFHFLSTCLNYTYYLNESDPPVNCGSGTFRGTFSIESGTSFSVALRAVAAQVFPDRAPTLASAYIDPSFEIDPIWAATHPGYSLAFEAGVGNGQPLVAAPVPEPETIALLGAGLLALTWRQRRRRHHAATAQAGVAD